MNVLMQKLKEIAAQARGVRLDVLLGRVAVGTGAVAALAPWTGLIPGKTGATIAGACAIAAGLTPRIQHAAGLFNAAYAGQKPLIEVLPQLLQMLVSAPEIVAQAQAEARAADAKRQAEEAQAQADRIKTEAAQAKAALVGEVALQVAELLKTGSFAKDALSADIPPALAAALAQGAVVSDPLESKPSEEQSAPVPPTLRAVTTVADKADIQTEGGTR